MHHLQTKILYNLALHDALRFSQLKPKDLESNQFMYHLKTVMAQGYVTKTDSRYRLTPKGLRYVNAMSFELLTTRLQPVSRTTVYAEHPDRPGEQLLYRFNRQPIRGRVGLLNGKIHFGETLEAAASRELHEKSGLQADLEFIGQINSRNYSADDATELINHTFYFVFRAHDVRGRLKDVSDIHGQSFWGKLEDCDPSQFTPGLSIMLQQIQSGQTGFFADITTQL